MLRIGWWALHLGCAVAFGILFITAVRLSAGPLNDADSAGGYHWRAALALRDAHALIDPSFHKRAQVPTGYPCTWEFLAGQLWRLAPHSDPPRLLNLLAWLLLGYATWRLAVLLRAGVFAAPAALLLLATPMVLQQTGGIATDVPMTAFLVAALLCALRLRQTSQPRYLLAGILSLAMAPAIKGSGLVYGVLALGPLLYAASRRRDAGSVRVSLCALPAALVIAGCWYVRNWIFLGKPVAVPNQPSSLLQLFNPSSSQDWRLLWHSFIWALGYPGLLLVGLALVAVGWTLIAGSVRDRRYALTAIAVLAVLFGLYVVSPYSASNRMAGYRLTDWFTPTVVRLAMPFLAIAAVTAAVAWGHLCPWSRFSPAGTAADGQPNR